MPTITLHQFLILSIVKNRNYTFQEIKREMSRHDHDSSHQALYHLLLKMSKREMIIKLKNYYMITTKGATQYWRYKGFVDGL